MYCGGRKWWCTSMRFAAGLFEQQQRARRHELNIIRVRRDGQHDLSFRFFDHAEKCGSQVRRFAENQQACWSLALSAR